MDIPASLSKTIFQKINQADKILLVSHCRPDGDSLGSLTALIILLEKLQKKYLAFSDGDIPLYYSFLPQVRQIANQPAKINLRDFDLIIALDSSDWHLTGLTEIANANNRPFLINIDHHIFNSCYGDLNLVNGAASCTEIITRLFRQNNLEIDRTMATCLLTGIVTDTNNFTNPTTSQLSFQTAAYLMSRGGPLNQIIRQTSKNKNCRALRFWGQVLNRLDYNCQTGLATAVITAQDFKLYDLTEQDIEGLANFLNNLQEARAVLLLKEEATGIIKGSFRSNDQTADLAKLAQVLGGGGHRQAAAFSMEGRLKHNGTSWEIV